MFLNTHVTADIDDLDAAIGALRARAAGNTAANPFGPRIKASSYKGLADAGTRAVEAGRLDLATVLALQYESGCIAATEGRRLILFLGLNAAIRRAIWEFGTAEIQRQGLGHEAYVELGRWLVLTTEMSSLAVGEGYRATERELLARDAAARRAAIDELLGAVPAGGGARHGCDDLRCASASSRTRAIEWRPSCRARTPIRRRSSPASTTPTSKRWPGGSTNRSVVPAATTTA